MRKLAAIMFTDIAGYTTLMGEDESKALQLLQRNRGLLKPIIEQFRGEWLKEIGDGTLSCFSSAVDAVNCALAIQQVLKDDPGLEVVSLGARYDTAEDNPLANSLGRPVCGYLHDAAILAHAEGLAVTGVLVAELHAARFNFDKLQ